MGFHLVFLPRRSIRGKQSLRRAGFSQTLRLGEDGSRRARREGRGEKDEGDEEHEKGKENGPLDVSILLRKP